MKVSLTEFYKQFKALVNTGIYDLLDRPNWSKGDLLYSKVENGVPGVTSAPLVSFYPIVTTDAELNNLKTANFGTVFNTWRKISLYGKNSMYNPPEAEAWSYDSVNDRIVCTVNSAQLTGFISPDSYDNYTMEVELSSTDGDDDAIGLMLAFTEEAGIPFSLVLYRNAGSGIGGWPLVVNMNPGPVADGARWVARVSGTLHYPDGNPIGTNGFDGLTNHGGWNTLGVIRVKVERSSTQIKVWTTDKGTPTVYDDANSFTIDLTAAADLKRFQQPCKIGYIAQSQNSSSFKVYQAPGSNVPIVDSRDGSMWKYEDRVWKQYLKGSAQVIAEFPQGRLFSSTVDKRMYFTNLDGVLLNVTPP